MCCYRETVGLEGCRVEDCCSSRKMVRVQSVQQVEAAVALIWTGSLVAVRVGAV